MEFEKFEEEKDNIQEKYGCYIDVDRAYEVISSALEESRFDWNGFFNQKEQAEEKYVNFLKEQGESNEFILNALFLLTTATFGSSSKVFFDNLSKTSDLYAKHRWLLVPNEVVKSILLDDDCIVGPYQLGLPTLNQNEKKIVTLEEGEVLFNREWEKYIKPMGYQGLSMRGWYENCRILCENYNGDVREFLKKNDNDAVKVKAALIYEPGGKSSKKEFKRIGEKLASLFLQWVGRYNLYELSNMDEFGLPVDLQLCRIAIQTGIVIPRGEIYRENLANDVLVPLIGWLCQKNDWKPRHVSEALWLIGSGGCTSDQSSLTPYPTCPLQDFCRGVVHKIDMNYWKFGNLDTMKNKVTFWNDMHRRLF